jgi:hypothetical protein
MEYEWFDAQECGPNRGVPVFALLPGGFIIIAVIEDNDSCLVWCNTYGNFHYDEKAGWVADDAEWDDDYCPVMWCYLPGFPKVYSGTKAVS